MKLRDWEDFAHAAQNYVDLMTAIRKLGSVTAAIRKKQRMLADSIQAEMMVTGQKRVLCKDWTSLEVRHTSRTETLKQEHAIIEFQDFMDLTQAEQAWTNIQASRAIIEAEKLFFTTSRSSS